MIPEKIRIDHAKSRGRNLFPCHYCYNFAYNPCEVGGANVVKSFYSLNQDEIARCDAGLTAPTGFGDCAKFILLDSSHRPKCNESVFQILESSYMMATIMAVYEHDGITRSDLIARNREGYNTRTQRIEELIQYGLVNTSFNIDNETCYHLTDSGEALAESIHQLYLTTVRVWEEGNLFDSFPDAIEVFEFVHHNGGCTRRRIYDTLSHIEDIEVLTTKLEELDYIKPVYDSTYTQITYESTSRGIRAWQNTRI